MKAAFIYSDTFAGFDYGSAHPLKTFRLKLTADLMKAYGLLPPPNACIINAQPADDEEILMFHDKEYVETLKAADRGTIIPGAEFFGLGPGDNPIFRGLFEWSRLVTGASLQAASIVARGEAGVAFNISGGLHHARAARASGFCYVNDPVIVIKSLRMSGQRVAYIDIDAHHGDGVQEAFYDTDTVLTISLHETGRMLFPGSGFEHETGTDKGEGYSVNIPLPPYADDELFVYAFDEIVPPLIRKFSPDIIVTQLGVDTFYSDPLAHLNITTNGFCEVVSRIAELSNRWVALGGGGYDVENVARAWTLAWAIMNGVDIPDEMPEDFLRDHAQHGFQDRKIRDDIYIERGHGKELMRQDVERKVSFIKENVFPKVEG